MAFSEGTKQLWYKTLTSRYNASNVVYLAYLIIILYIDYHLEPEVSALSTAAPSCPSSASSSTTSSTSTEESGAIATLTDRINYLYLVANCIHLINAYMYYWQWCVVCSGVDSTVQDSAYH